MPDNDELRETLMKVSARVMALETLVLAMIAQSPDKIKILSAYEHELEGQSTRTLFESQLKDHPEKELPVACDQLLVQVAALCSVR